GGGSNVPKRRGVRRGGKASLAPPWAPARSEFPSFFSPNRECRPPASESGNITLGIGQGSSTARNHHATSLPGPADFATPGGHGRSERECLDQRGRPPRTDSSLADRGGLFRAVMDCIPTRGHQLPLPAQPQGGR